MLVYIKHTENYSLTFSNAEVAKVTEVLFLSEIASICGFGDKTKLFAATLYMYWQINVDKGIVYNSWVNITFFTCWTNSYYLTQWHSK